MVRIIEPAQVARPPQPRKLFWLATLALATAACSDSTPLERVLPTGRLAQPADRGPITHVTAEGWRTRIEGGQITIQPPEASCDPGLQYVSWRMREQLGTHDLRAWSDDRRTVLLPGGARITMHGQAGEILRLSVYDGTESHEIDVLTQTLMHSRVDASVAGAREVAEADGETATLRELCSAGVIHGLDLTNLYVQPADATGAPLPRQAAVQVLGRQHGPDLQTVSLPPAPAPEADEVCMPTTLPRGRLMQNEAGMLEYNTRSGLWKILVNLHTITVTRSGRFTWQVWGDPHENLNGKHIKDWNGTRRTLLLDDGTKITMSTDGPHGLVQVTSLYDGAQSHEIGNVGNMIRHSCVNAQEALARDAAEADGETARLVNLKGPAMVNGYLYVENVYTEESGAGGVEEPEFETVPLGQTGDDDNPNQVSDLYDDPRLGHT